MEHTICQPMARCPHKSFTRMHAAVVQYDVTGAVATPLWIMVESCMRVNNSWHHGGICPLLLTHLHTTRSNLLEVTSRPSLARSLPLSPLFPPGPIPTLLTPHPSPFTPQSSPRYYPNFRAMRYLSTCTYLLGITKYLASALPLSSALAALLHTLPPSHHITTSPQNITSHQNHTSHHIT